MVRSIRKIALRVYCTYKYVDAIIIFILFLIISGAVVQLKTISGALSADENLSKIALEKTSLLQQILVHVVSIMCSFIDLNSNVNEKSQLYSNILEFSVPSASSLPTDSSGSLKDPICEPRIQWHRKAVVSVMEAGGLNWLVGKVRIFSNFLVEY